MIELRNSLSTVTNGCRERLAGTYPKLEMKNLEIVKTFALPPCTFLECPEEFSVDADTGNVWIIDRNGLFSISSANDMVHILQ